MFAKQAALSRALRFFQKSQLVTIFMIRNALLVLSQQTGLHFIYFNRMYISFKYLSYAISILYFMLLQVLYLLRSFAYREG